MYGVYGCVLVTWTYGGTAGGANCAFPFTFDNAEHNDCIVSNPGEKACCKTENCK